jgi:hypothetical protein
MIKSHVVTESFSKWTKRVLAQSELNEDDVPSLFLPKATVYTLIFFLICVVGGGIKVHSTLRPLNGLLCQPRVIMIMEKSVEW